MAIDELQLGLVALRERPVHRLDPFGVALVPFLAFDVSPTTATKRFA
jgi:hypothetical protein